MLLFLESLFPLGERIPVNVFSSNDNIGFIVFQKIVFTIWVILSDVNYNLKKMSGTNESTGQFYFLGFFVRKLLLNNLLSVISSVHTDYQSIRSGRIIRKVNGTFIRANVFLAEPLQNSSGKVN